MKLEQILILVLIGIMAGFIGGMAGIGGGLVIVPLLIMFMGMSQHQAQGTSIGTLVIPIALLAAINYSKAGYINWKFVVFLALSFMVGSYFGSKLAISLDAKLLKRIFGTIMIIAAIKMYWDSFK
ncbi:sulfite exporter TauE/SafE family protein [Weeksellaceae bacterium KMM 9713]|uniref:Probable membrane transporter protein n=1 Tax=Profundicola chukchiensis TaxID=2961959 RepID=A0A9X4MXU5_9FLAO|nr:sulfite exporter TauE/SafE family protein [Profundicola chukchiensis]MDG4946866.1 sulfite exporter TauE/SafE family protein [Profundicola chukchiensis]MDG4951322.1 sulfite exporter TauE/SafE family protein [Profundicola chukchiensis]